MHRMFAAITFLALGAFVASVGSNPLPTNVSSPCPEIFRYEQVSNGQWTATITLISDSDLHGLWVRLLTRPKLENLVIPDGYQAKYNDTEEVRISNREDILTANVAKTLTIKGNLIDGQTPELLSIVLNGKRICSSDKLSSSVLYGGDFNNKDYLSSVSKNNPSQTPPQAKKCGKALLLNSLIPNDNIKVLPGDWPWQAGLFKERNGTSSLLCEATLISDKAVLTSAHCVTWDKSALPVSPSLLTVRLKNLNVEEVNQEDIFGVEKVVIHPGFNDKTLADDIALIRLQKSVVIDDATQPICLPSGGRLPEESYVLGYGFKQDGSLTNLGVAKVKPLSEEKCVELEPSYKTLANDDNFCASYVQDHEVCIGSSGSGVMDVKSDSEFIWELRGVLSVGRALQEKFRCNENSPVLITEVSKYLKWIKGNAN